jgi:hypothetical protein
MEPYQQKHTHQANAASNINETTISMISDESCEHRRTTPVEYSTEQDDNNFSLCVRNELLDALACLDQLEKTITSVPTISPTTACDQRKDKQFIDLEQQKLMLNPDDIPSNSSDSKESSRLYERDEGQIKIQKDEKCKSSSVDSENIDKLMERIQISDRNLLDIQKENEILKKSLEATVLENASLRKEKHELTEGLKSATKDKEELKDELIKKKEEDVHQNCKDKIAALRNVARALENENELLLEQIKLLESRSASDKNGTSKETSEKIKSKELEIKELTQKYEQKKAENVKLMDRIIGFEQELETERIFGKNVMIRVSDLQETLDAVKQGKRSVEENLQLIVEQNETLQKKVYEIEIESNSLSETNMRLEEQIHENTSTTGALSTATDNLEQEIAMQASFYEDKIESMQREMNDRLEEMSVSQEGDAEDVRIKYCDLFDEKANELHDLRKEYEKQGINLQEVEQRLADQELMEHENKEKMEKSQKCHNEDLDKSLNSVQTEISYLHSGTTEMEQELQSLRKRYDNLQLSYLNAIAHFKSRLCKVNQTEKSERSMQIQQQSEVNGTCNENGASLSESSSENMNEESRLSLSSGDDCSSGDSSSNDSTNPSQNETDDDDSGIKVEISETTLSHINNKENENIQIHKPCIAISDTLDINGCSNNLSEENPPKKELKTVVIENGIKTNDFERTKNKSRNARRKRR